MTTNVTRTSRDRISVDLRGMRAALFKQARARGVSPSDVVREALSESLGQVPSPISDEDQNSEAGSKNQRVRLSLRMSRQDALATLAAARAARLPPGAYVAGLVANVPILRNGGERADHLSALTASSAELAALSRNLRYLTNLLRQGSSRVAQEYRAMLDEVAHDVHGHLKLASSALAELQPKHRVSTDVQHQSD